MNLQASLTEIFIDPISLERMHDPIINQCGHTYERTQIEGWIARKVQAGEVANCPLCRLPVAGLIPNLILGQALEILDAPVNALTTRIEELTGEEQEQISAAINIVIQRRQQDQASGIPDRLPESVKFLSKVAGAISGVYYCHKC